MPFESVYASGLKRMKTCGTFRRPENVPSFSGALLMISLQNSIMNSSETAEMPTATINGGGGTSRVTSINTSACTAFVFSGF